MQTNKEKYLSWAETISDLPIFYQGWWLDAVSANDDWDVVLAEMNNQIVGALPHIIERERFFTFIKMAKLTPYLGPWLQYPDDQKYASRLSFEKDVFNALIDKLPKFDKFNLAFNPGIKNWLPFYWAGFKQSTRYTYILSNNNPDKIFSDFQGNIRREIRKAEKVLSVSETDNIEKFYDLNSMTFGRQKSENPVTLTFLTNLDKVLKLYECKKILFAKDKSGQIHSAGYFIYDKDFVYYLLGGSDPKLRNSGAASLVMWEAIKFAMETGRSFNFEGSMHEAIERFFRGFGAIQTPYFRITKINSKTLKLLNSIK